MFNRLNDASSLYSSHFATSFEGTSLFDCWFSRPYSSVATYGFDISGVSWGIMPGLFHTYNGNQSASLPHYPNTPFVIEDDEERRTFVGDDNSGLTLTQNSNSQFGLDLSPPNSVFGENVIAPDGSNYVALFDFENSDWNCGPTLVTELKYALVKDVKYEFSMSFAKMNLLGYIKSQEGWDQVKEGKLKVWVCNSNINQKQLICTIDVNDNAWDITTWEFKANKNSTHLLIEYNPINAGLLAPINSKIAGVFIDHLKLFEACETPLNQCDNALYRRDLLDVKLQKVELTSPYVNPTPGDNGPGIMKTVRAFHLENVKRFEMKIYIATYSTPCRTIDMWYPQTEYIWDGKDDNGEMMPDGDYRAIINAVSNDCFHITNADTKDFKLLRDYSLFNVQIGNGIEDGNARIWGLDKVKTLTVEILTAVGQTPIFTHTYANPRSIIGLSIESIQALSGNLTLPPAQYVIRVTANNNCNHESVITHSASIGHDIASNTDPLYLALYDYASIPKGIFECPYDFHYNQNVLSPMDCCEGNLYLNDMDIWNSWGTINIENNIYIGPNVIFENGTYNYLNAGEQIIFIPDQQTGVTVLGEAIFKPNTFECQICKSYEVHVIDDNEADEEGSDRAIVMMSKDSFESKEMVLFPNPVLNGQEMTLQAGTESIDPINYQLVLSNSLGVTIPLKIIDASERTIRFKPSTIVSSGAYYLYFESNGAPKTFSVIIR